MIVYLTVIISILVIAYICSLLTKGHCKSYKCLVGKTAIVTGGNSGIGYQVVLGLAARGCKVIIADVADSKMSRDNVIKDTGNLNIVCKYINMASYNSIRVFAQDIIKNEERLDILVNNAGCAYFPQKETEDGCNIGIQVNHLGGFLLTHLLMDLLKKSAPSRITFTTSLMAFVNNLTVDNFNKPNLNLLVYCNSKLCNIITAKELAKRLKGSGVTANSIHPGLVNTAIHGKVNNESNIHGMKFLLAEILYKFILPIYGKTAEEGAETILHVALSNNLENVSGVCFSDCAPLSVLPGSVKNEKFCQKIWTTSEELTKLKPHEKL